MLIGVLGSHKPSVRKAKKNIITCLNSEYWIHQGVSDAHIEDYSVSFYTDIQSSISCSISCLYKGKTLTISTERYDGLGAYISLEYTVDGNNVKETLDLLESNIKTVKVPINARCIKISINTHTTGYHYIENIMVEESFAVTEFEPHMLKNHNSNKGLIIDSYNGYVELQDVSNIDIGELLNIEISFITHGHSQCAIIGSLDNNSIFPYVVKVGEDRSLFVAVNTINDTVGGNTGFKIDLKKEYVLKVNYDNTCGLNVYVNGEKIYTRPPNGSIDYGNYTFLRVGHNFKGIIKYIKISNENRELLEWDFESEDIKSNTVIDPYTNSNGELFGEAKYIQKSSIGDNSGDIFSNFKTKSQKLKSTYKTYPFVFKRESFEEYNGKIYGFNHPRLNIENGILVENGSEDRKHETLYFENMLQYFDEERGTLELVLETLSGEGSYSDSTNGLYDISYYNENGFIIRRNSTALNQVEFIVKDYEGAITHKACNFIWKNGDRIKYRLDWNKLKNETILTINDVYIINSVAFAMPINIDTILGVGYHLNQCSRGNAIYYSFNIRDRWGRTVYSIN